MKLLRREPPPDAARATTDGFSPLPPLFADPRAAAALSDAWRVRRPGPSLRSRRRVIAANAGSTVIMSLLSLYQTGTLRTLPELRSRWFDAGRVDVSAQAFQLGFMPDAPAAAANFALTSVLAAAAGPDERSRPAVRLALAGKIAFDAAYAAKLLRDQPVKHKALCSYCVVSALLTFSGLPAAAGEARRGWRGLREGPRT